MTKPNDIIIKTAPRVHLNVHPAERWQFIQDDVGIRAVPWFDLNRLTEQERVGHDAALDDPSNFVDSEQEAFMLAHCPRFPTLALAEAWAALEDREVSIAEDLQAFWAPSECGTAAYAQLEVERAALLTKEIT